MHTKRSQRQLFVETSHRSAVKGKKKKKKRVHTVEIDSTAAGASATAMDIVVANAQPQKQPEPPSHDPSAREAMWGQLAAAAVVRIAFACVFARAHCCCAILSLFWLRWY